MFSASSLLKNCLLIAFCFLIIFASCSSDTAMEEMEIIEPAITQCNQDIALPNQSPYILPFPVGKEYLLSQSYCPTNPNWGHHNLFAYDFDMPNRDTIIASRAGKVLILVEDKPNIGGDCSGGKENFLFIEHGDGSVMQYYHLVTNGVLVEKGDFVRQGQAIGLSGDSGCSSGPHLHVGLYPDRFSYDRPDSQSFNYSNAVGRLDASNGLVGGVRYKAKVF